MTAIEWVKNTDGSQGKTWNPIVGCSVVSPGCTNCYAMRMAARLERMGLERYRGLTKPSKAGPVWTGETRLVDEALTEPLRRRKPTMWFVNSMSDLFHESVPDAWIDRVFAVMAASPTQTFQVLTKRPARMRAYLSSSTVVHRIIKMLCELSAHLGSGKSSRDWRGGSGWNAFAAAENLTIGNDGSSWPLWPLSNVWLGVSTEDQRRADERVPDLLATPAAVRFVSAEPLLGPIDFRNVPYPSPPEEAGLRGSALDGHEVAGLVGNCIAYVPALDWIIVGGESGPGARPMHPAWARSIRDQCAAAGVPYFFKQWGSWAMRGTPGITFPEATAAPCLKLTTAGDDGSRLEARGDEPVWMQVIGKKAAGRLLDGIEHNGMPEVRA